MWETLESRTLFAGNMTLSTAGAVATILGDVKGNAVAITPASGGYLVTPLNYTKLNGGSASLFVSSTVTQFKTNLGGGNDKLTVSDIALPTLTVADTGGDDFIQLNNSTFNTV